MLYRMFDVVLIDKIHYNVFFDSIKDKDLFARRLVSSQNLDWLVKRRPALIVGKFKHRSGSSVLTKYLVIPFTSKRSINGWVQGERKLRILFKEPLLKNGYSYLMLDAMLTLTEDQIISLYSHDKNTIKLKDSQKRFVLRELTYKWTNLLDIPKEFQ